VRKVEISEIGSDYTTELVSDGAGNWTDGSATAQPHLANAIDVDISITPFINTLPVRRLDLRNGQSQEILVVYIQLPNITIATDRQRYTCLEAGRRYRYESVDSDFIREIEFDAHGLVTDYPGLFRREPIEESTKPVIKPLLIPAGQLYFPDLLIDRFLRSRSSLSAARRRMELVTVNVHCKPQQ
jgi:Putative glycolipid-binding